MPIYSHGDIVMIASEDEENVGGTAAILSEIFGNEALVLVQGKDDQKMTVPLNRLEPFYRTDMKLAH